MPSSSSPSQELPRFFEAQYADYADDLPFWLELAERCRGPILELGCGTGRVLLALARAGHAVEGLDHHPEMVQRAENRLRSELGRSVPLHCADLRGFSVSQRYSLVIVSCNTLAGLDDAGFAASLQVVRSHLLRPGTFAAELPHPIGEADVPPDLEREPLANFRDPETGHPVQLSARQTMDSARRIAQVTWQYDELFPDGRVARREFAMLYHLRAAREVAALLRSAGFRRPQFFGDYDRSRLRRTSPRMLVVARAA